MNSEMPQMTGGRKRTQKRASRKHRKTVRKVKRGGYTHEKRAGRPHSRSQKRRR